MKLLVFKLFLSNLLFQDESYWKQRAKIFCSSEGDANTKVFHAITTFRQRINCITGLLVADDKWVDNQADLCVVVHQYCTELFTTAPLFTTASPLRTSHRVSPADNEVLLAPVSIDEFDMAIKHIHPHKAVGPDGLIPGFFHQFEPLLTYDIFRACVSWIQNKVFLSTLNNNFLTPCLKCENPITMRDLRPIACCNVLYKIIAKSLQIV